MVCGGSVVGERVLGMGVFGQQMFGTVTDSGLGVFFWATLTGRAYMRWK